MKQDRDRLQEIMEMFHQCGQTMISADTLRETIECGDFEANGFGRHREEAHKLGQAMIEHGLIFDRPGVTPCNQPDGHRRDQR
jgi:hypothetical protein